MRRLRSFDCENTAFISELSEETTANNNTNQNFPKKTEASILQEDIFCGALPSFPVSRLKMLKEDEHLRRDLSPPRHSDGQFVTGRNNEHD